MVIIEARDGRQAQYETKYAAYFQLMQEFRGQEVRLYVINSTHVDFEILEISESGKSIKTRSVEQKEAGWSGVPMLQEKLSFG